MSGQIFAEEEKIMVDSVQRQNPDCEYHGKQQKHPTGILTAGRDRLVIR